MTREEAIRIVAAQVPEEAALIACNGHISRALYSIVDRPTHFYMIGSMGLSSSIALGMVLARPETHAVVFDGDGNVLMNMGGLASVAAAKPRRFTHFCFDNGRHASTGGQTTISGALDLSSVARGAGYVWTDRATSPAEVETLAKEAFRQEGPAFLLIKVEPGGLPEGTARVDLTPEQMTDRMRERFGS